jgi:hypothetical protein
MTDKLRMDILGTREKQQPSDETEDKLSKELEQIRRWRLWDKALGGDDKGSGGLPVGEVFAAMQSLVKAATDQVTSLKAQNPNDPLVSHLMEELKDIKVNMNRPSADPFDLFLATKERLGLMAGMIKESLHLPEGRAGADIAGTAANLPLLVETKRLELESGDRQRQHEEKMEEIKHAHAMEREEFKMNFELKVKELGVNQERQGNTADMIGTLLTGVASAIDVERGPTVAARPEAAEPVARPKTRVITCNCGAKLAVPPGKNEVVCPQCQLEWGFEPDPAPAAAAAENKAPA